MAGSAQAPPCQFGLGRLLLSRMAPRKLMSLRQLIHHLKRDHGFSEDEAEATARAHFESDQAQRTYTTGRVWVWVKVQVVDGQRMVVHLPLTSDD